MRSLIVFFLVASSSVSFALSQTLITDFTVDHRDGPLFAIDRERVFRVSQISESISYRVEGIWNSLTVTPTVVLRQPDYDSVILRDESGVESSLADSVKHTSEVASALNLNWAKGENSISFGVEGTLSSSPYAYHLLNAGYERSFFNRSTVVEVTLAYLNQKQPENYFLDFDFTTKPSPQKVHGWETLLSLEQVFNPDWKGRLSASLGARVEERPASIILKTNQAYALSDTIFTDLELSYGTEFRSQSLKDTRGYFRNYSAKLGLTYEPIYDFLLTASYGLIFEQEDDPRIGQKIQVAGDQYALGIRHQLTDFEWRLQAAYLETNTSVTNLQFTGGVSWPL